APQSCDLRDGVRCGAKAGETEQLALASSAQRGGAEQARAEERRDREIGEAVRQREAVALVGNRPLRVAAVEVVAGEAGAVAEVLAAARAVAALAARPAEPRHAEPAAVLGLADDLVAEDERQLRPRQLAVGDVAVG